MKKIKTFINDPVSIEPEFKIGDEITLVDGISGHEELVTITGYTPHPDVRGSFYYEFSNGQCCRDIRLHSAPAKEN